jgi:hypothetical protein
MVLSLRKQAWACPGTYRVMSMRDQSDDANFVFRGPVNNALYTKTSL